VLLPSIETEVGCGGPLAMDWLEAGKAARAENQNREDASAAVALALTGGFAFPDFRFQRSAGGEAYG